MGVGWSWKGTHGSAGVSRRGTIQGDAALPDCHPTPADHVGHKSQGRRGMKKLVLALIIGVIVGYSWGYGDGDSGRGTIASRTLNRFGSSKLRAASEANDRRINDASKP